MHDHPILGAVLFAIGAALVGIGFCDMRALAPQLSSSLDGAAPGETISYLIFGHVIAFNGVLLVVLGRRKPRRV